MLLSRCTFVILAWLAFAAAWSLSTQTRAQTFGVFRYDDDVSQLSDPAARQDAYGQLKYIPLGAATDEYLSFGGELRERFESQRDAIVGFGKVPLNDYDLQRLLLEANLQYDSFRGFVQLGSHLEWGRVPGPIPTDIDRLDIQQAFADYRIGLGAGSFTLRAGRAEMSFDDGAFISFRDGPNVRLSFDGVRGMYQLGTSQLDVFAVKPVNVSPGSFDDVDVKGQALWGLHGTAGQKTLAVDYFCYGNTMEGVRVFGAEGAEETHTFGARIRGNADGFDGALAAAYQFGSLGEKDIRAFNLHGIGGYTFNSVAWSPSISLRADILSGGDNSGHTVHTFNALYPNYSYSTEAAIEAPANLIEPALVSSLHPTKDLTLQYTLEGLWRYSLKDGFYAAPYTPLVAPGCLSSPFSGIEQQIEASFALNEFATLKTAYVYFASSDSLRAAGGRDEQFIMSSLSVRF